MSGKSDFHNELAARFVFDIIGQAIKHDATFSELMVIFESVQLAMLEVLNKHYGLKEHVATGLFEASVQNAIERFAKARAA